MDLSFHLAVYLECSQCQGSWSVTTWWAMVVVECVLAHMCTTDGVNCSISNKENDKVWVSVSVCLFSKMLDPSCSIGTCKPTPLRPPTRRKINLAKTFPAPPGPSRSPLTHVEAGRARFDPLPPLTAATDPHALNHNPWPWQRAMVLKTSFPACDCDGLAIA